MARSKADLEVQIQFAYNRLSALSLQVDTLKKQLVIVEHERDELKKTGWNPARATKLSRMEYAFTALRATLESKLSAAEKIDRIYRILDREFRFIKGV